MKYFLFSFLFSVSLASFAQNNLSGKVFNNESEPLIGATIVLLNLPDSTIYSFCLTNNDGEFAFKNLPLAKFVLQVSYVSYTNHNEFIHIVHDSKRDVILPTIILKESTEVLQEVTITAEHIPMGINGDTISYNAAAFKTKTHATVEDLLKKLPGIEVERNGNIKAQGKDVKNVLVDGKEFFGSDPKMATKNLEAIAVEKVQVFDKKSEVAEFTGVDDGEEEKTINLKLKEDYKQGGFGSARLALGTEDTYSAKLNYFRFNPKMQSSLIFAANNLNEETFTINDKIEFLGGLSNALANGDLNLSERLLMPNGLNESLSTGLNFNYDFSKNILFNSHYILNNRKNKLDQNASQWGFYDESNFVTSEETLSARNDLSHGLNTKLKIKLNPFAELVFLNNLDYNEFNDKSDEFSTYSLMDSFLGSSNSFFNADAHEFNWKTQTTFKRKFELKGRSFISSISLNNEIEKSEENINILNDQFNNRDSLLQDQVYDNDLLEAEFRATYTEPLVHKIFISTDYSFAKSIETPQRIFFNLLDNKRQKDVASSALYKKEYDYHLAGLSLRRNNRKFRSQIGLKVQHTNLKGSLNTDQGLVDDNFTNLLPFANIELKVKGGNAKLRYKTTIIAPRLEQMLPIINNQRPNFEFTGNPFLRPSYERSLGLSFHYFDNFSFMHFIGNIDYVSTKDRIVNKIDIDDNLIQMVSPINTKKYNAFNTHFDFSRPLNALKLKYKIRMRTSLANYDSFINGQASGVNHENYNLKASFSNKNTDKIEISVGALWDWDLKSYEENPDFNQKFSRSSYFFDFDWYLPKAFVFSAKYDFTKNTNNFFGDEPSFNLVELSLSKQFLKNRLDLGIAVYDLFNQNIGYERFGDLNSVYETNFINLSRYYMLSIQFKIGKKKEQGGIRIDLED